MRDLRTSSWGTRIPVLSYAHLLQEAVVVGRLLPGQLVPAVHEAVQIVHGELPVPRAQAGPVRRYKGHLKGQRSKPHRGESEGQQATA